MRESNPNPDRDPNPNANLDRLSPFFDERVRESEQESVCPRRAVLLHELFTALEVKVRVIGLLGL